MIIALESIRTNRIRALRALRTLHYVDPKYEEDCQCYNPFKPGLKEAQEMLDSLPLSARILPEDLSKFEEDFYIQVLSNPPSDYDMLGDCICGPDTYDRVVALQTTDDGRLLRFTEIPAVKVKRLRGVWR